MKILHVQKLLQARVLSHSLLLDLREDQGLPSSSFLFQFDGSDVC